MTPEPEGARSWMCQPGEAEAEREGEAREPRTARVWNTGCAILFILGEFIRAAR